jgi:hypothetical protein
VLALPEFLLADSVGLILTHQRSSTTQAPELNEPSNISDEEHGCPVHERVFLKVGVHSRARARLTLSPYGLNHQPLMAI